MNIFATIRNKFGIYELYGRFELAVSALLMLLISIIILYSIVILAMTLFDELIGGYHQFETAALKDTFGLMLTVLILLEFNHSIALAMRRRAGVLQVRVIVVIAIIVIARKLILLDYATTDLSTLLALGGLALALGAVCWLLNEIERRRRAAGMPED
ncbi:MAG: phosphate-starvation-inducible PsiE family protein [Alphaproteobacteria bacterium]|nr:phosphate-starvation-inducible PsiE family protein [Alphaproteobacteria bacterium]